MSSNTHYIGKVMMQERKTWRYGDFTADDAKEFGYQKTRCQWQQIQNMSKTSQGQICLQVSNHNKQLEALRACDVVDVIKIT